MIDSGPTEAVAPFGKGPRKWYVPSSGAIIAILLAALAPCTCRLLLQAGQEAIHTAAENGDAKRVRDILDRDAAAINARTKLGWTPLYLAAMEGHKAVVALLLQRGAEVDSRNLHQETPLAKAAKFGHKEVVEQLLARGADVNTRDFQGLTPLHWAVSGGHKDVVKLLLANGADVNARGGSGATPLDIATRPMTGPHRGRWREIGQILREHDSKKPSPP